MTKRVAVRQDKTGRLVFANAELWNPSEAELRNIVEVCAWAESHLLVNGPEGVYLQAVEAGFTARAMLAKKRAGLRGHIDVESRQIPASASR